MSPADGNRSLDVIRDQAGVRTRSRNSADGETSHRTAVKGTLSKWLTNLTL